MTERPAAGRSIRHELIVPASATGKRLDQLLAETFPDYSRTRIQAWIRAGLVRVDERPVRPRERLSGGEHIRLQAQFEERTADRPQPLPLRIVHEDADLIIVDKPAGQIVHPGAGNPDGTLVNALLHHAAGLAELPRAGIVHRLDKDTSGLLIVARTVRSHTALVAQLEAREISRQYAAVCYGRVTAGATVDAPLGRHASDRKRMSVRQDGRRAVTHYRVQQRFRAHSLLAVRLETGRTHQIRVHLAHVGYPLVGDPLYGRRLAIPAGMSESCTAALRAFRRQALHAARLEFAHPVTGAAMAFSAPVPSDFGALVRALAEDAVDA